KPIWHSDELYKNLLPTLGPRVIGPMVERIRLAVGVDEEVESGPWPFARFLSDAVVQIGRQHPIDVAEWGRRMIEDECATIRRAGLHVLKHFPNVAVLNKLWELHKVNYDVYLRKEGERWWAGYKRSFAALKSCTRLKPEWLERRILDSKDGSEPFTELAYLVANLQGSTGKELWHRVKSALFNKVPSDRPRCLVTCIRQHGDSKEISRLESWLSQEGDSTRESAFQALVYLAPEKAISSLRRLDTLELYATRKWWRPGLLLRFPDETRNQIREIVEDSTDARWHGANIYQDDPNQMDEATLDLLLDKLEKLVPYALDPLKKLELFSPLRLLADVTRLDLLWRFEERAGTPLERLLTDLTCSWVDRMKVDFDHELEPAIQILIKTAGVGLTKLVNKQLASESKYARLKGIQLSLIRPDSETRRLLANITQTAGFWDDEQSFPLLQADATVALAALGENRAVVDAILRWGVVLSDLPGMREGQPPMTDADLAEAIEALGSSDTNTATNAVLALSVSGRADFAPQIRQILKDADPESELARVAVVALDHFGDTHPETLTLLEAQLKVRQHAHAASLALLRNGKRESLAVVEREFRRAGSTRGKLANDFLAVSLAMRQESRKTVAEVLWKRIQEHRELYGVIPGLDCLAEIDSPQVREFLVEEAHAAEGVLGNNGRKVAAIHALAKIDRDSAFRAAEAALRGDQRHLELYPDALIEIDEARAISILFDIYSLDQPTLVRWAIGRALRRASDQTIIHSTLGEMLQAESTDTCIIGLEISDWQSPSVAENQIRQIAITNPVSEVRRAAEQTVGSIERQGFALKLIEEIGKTHGARCWSYLDAVVSLSDPWLLTRRSDPLYLWGPLSRKLPGLGNRALELIKRRQEKLKSEAEKADRDRNR
ncbi:MAG: hypothetical protein IID44_17425, partial [Planctomycetes bacterium]|nr:hypothetical protein [Planctomycetota bacterium]